MSKTWGMNHSPPLAHTHIHTCEHMNKINDP